VGTLLLLAVRNRGDRRVFGMLKRVSQLIKVCSWPVLEYLWIRGWFTSSTDGGSSKVISGGQRAGFCWTRCHQSVTLCSVVENAADQMSVSRWQACLWCCAVCHIGSNLSGVYRMQLAPGHYVFVQTKSKLFKNSASGHPEFIMSTHSIVRCVRVHDSRCTVDVLGYVILT